MDPTDWSDFDISYVYQRLLYLVGALLVKKRVINGIIHYIKGIQKNRNKLLESILYINGLFAQNKKFNGSKQLGNIRKTNNTSFNDIRLKSKEYLT